MTTALWIIAVLLMVAGLVGVVLPALPGVPLLFAGMLLAAWSDDFQRISGWTVTVMAILTLLALVVDYGAAALSAKRAGASRQGLLGAAAGTLAGLFTGLWGLLFLPLAGAALGEMIAHQDLWRAGRVGVATWLGLVMAGALKLAVAFAMVGLFVAALLL
jgi:uncharacterized protein YqgC (DUF456 family)